MSAEPKPRGNPRARRILDLATTALFLAGICAPALAALLRPDAASRSVEDEQRTPSGAPGFPRNVYELALLPPRVEAWFDDHLGLRDVLLEARSRLLLFGLGVSPTPSAVIGPDGWLWYAKEHTFEAWCGTSPLSAERVTAWQRVLRDRAEWCRAHGIVYVVAFTPNKMEVYPARVPSPYERIGPSRYDQMNAALLGEPGGWYLDMRAELIEESTRDAEADTVYWQRGTHWSTRGAMRGALALLRHARAAGVDVEVPPVSAFELRPVGFDDDMWTRQLHLPELGLEIQLGLQNLQARGWTSDQVLDAIPKRVETEADGEHLPRLWMAHDSFGLAIRPMLAPFFARTTFDWANEHTFDPPAMLAFEPDLVVDLYTERVFEILPPNRIGSADEAARRARFERGERSSWKLDPATAAATADPGVHLTRADGAIAFASSEVVAGVVLTDAAMTAEETPVLRIELEAEHKGPFYVQWSRAGQDGWRRTAAAPRRLVEGRQEIFVEVLDPSACGPIRLIPSREVGTVRVTALEIRDAGW